MENKTITDQIYAELVDGLKTGLDWPHFLSKHGASKGPLYNAIGRFFNDMEAKVRALNTVQRELDQAGLRLDSLNQKTKDVEDGIEAKTRGIAGMEDKERALKKQIETIESEVANKTQFAKELAELEKLGFDTQKLQKMHSIISGIGTQRGLKPRESVDRFFADLEDYDAKVGFQQEIERLDVIIRTKNLEADKWRVEAETYERRYKEFQEAIGAIQSLSKQGAKPEQIISWNNSLTSIGGVEEFEKGLSRYGSIQKLLAAKKREAKHLDTKVAKLNGQVNTLKEQKAEIEGAIKTLRASAVTEIERLGKTGLEALRAQKTELEGSIKTLKTSALNEMKEISQTGVETIGKVAQAGSNSLRQTGETALSELKQALSMVDDISARALEVGKIIGQDQAELNKIKETKEKAEELTRGIEGYKWSN